jgi:hypothetical protein
MNELLLLSLFPPEVQIGRRLTTLLRNFSGSRDLRVARGQRECLSQRPLSDSQTNDQVCSASMIDFDVNSFPRLNLRDKTVDRILECATTTF